MYKVINITKCIIPLYFIDTDEVFYLKPSHSVKLESLTPQIKQLIDPFKKALRIEIYNKEE